MPSRLSAFVVGVAVIGVVSVGGLALASRLAEDRSAAGGRVAGHLTPCPETPNCVCSENGPGESIEPFPFRGDPEAALARLLALVQADPRATVETVEESYVHAVFRSDLFGFPDDLELRLDRDAGVIHVRSASRIGHSDLGANRKRVETLRRGWRPEE